MDERAKYVNPEWSDAEWDVSGAFVNDRELLAFFDFCKGKLGYEPFRIVHGAPLCAWNSGRVLKQLLREAEEMRAAGLEYEKRGIAVYLTFSNLLLSEAHLADPICNALCTFFSRHNPTKRNSVIIGTDLLLRHVRERFPELRRVSSILHIVQNNGKGKPEVYRELLQKYDEVMVHPDDVLNEGLLRQLGDPSRFILLINEYCIRNCPLRGYHYKSLSENALNFVSYDGREFDKRQASNGCRELNKMLTHERYGVLALNTTEIRRLYDMGFRHFKLQGRGHSNASAILFDLMRLTWRNDAPNENRMHTIGQRFLESLRAPLPS